MGRSFEASNFFVQCILSYLSAARSKSANDDGGVGSLQCTIKYSGLPPGGYTMVVSQPDFTFNERDCTRELQMGNQLRST